MEKETITLSELGILPHSFKPQEKYPRFCATCGYRRKWHPILVIKAFAT